MVVLAVPAAVGVPETVEGTTTVGEEAGDTTVSIGDGDTGLLDGSGDAEEVASVNGVCVDIVWWEGGREGVEQRKV